MSPQKHPILNHFGIAIEKLGSRNRPALGVYHRTLSSLSRPIEVAALHHSNRHKNNQGLDRWILPFTANLEPGPSHPRDSAPLAARFKGVWVGRHAAPPKHPKQNILGKVINKQG
jgi:hypothetical protein